MRLEAALERPTTWGPINHLGRGRREGAAGASRVSFPLSPRCKVSKTHVMAGHGMVEYNDMNLLALMVESTIPNQRV